MATNDPKKILRLVLGDQLNSHHSWFQNDPHAETAETIYLIAELLQETAYVKHHVQKLCAFFAAMQHFAGELTEKGYQVHHLTLDDSQHFACLGELIQATCADLKVTQFEYQRPDEYRLLQQLEELKIENVDIRATDSEHFLVPFDELNKHFKPATAHRMEHFYRTMRKRSNILLDGDQPLGGQWNYDVENRNKLKQAHLADIPEPLCFKNDVSDIKRRLDDHKVNYFGEYQEALPWPISRHQAEQLLDHFCTKCLSRFGQFQDAMTDQSEYAWSLYHSRLSFAINTKMLSPMTVVERAIREFEVRKSETDLAQIEGFVRQIIGWREFIRGMYWANMPAYQDKNQLGAPRKLPDFFWTGETQMHCMQQSLGQSLQHAYAHHIQRLMVIGNFCLLTGIAPQQVDDWYLGVYIDAIEWVEMPNTRGMSQFADGGLVASKPYAASGAYINRMSDYCRQCSYSVQDKTGDKPCPFNSLYWHFIHQHKDKFSDNPRMTMVYRNWERMDDTLKTETLKQAEYYLETLEQL